ncbi:MAG: ABC transporter substrate-binding protein [Hyphomicrobiaceae bacterium]
MAAKPTMNLAGLRFDRTAAVVDGMIKMDSVNVSNVPGGKAAIQGLLGNAFDASEVPFSRYVSWIANGRKLKAVPVFSDRLFQHEYIYTRPDTGITSLADLRGRRVVCAPSYFATPSFWHRALLKEAAGIEPHEIEWHSPAAEAEEMRLPTGVTVKQSPTNILGLERLLDGTADALMTARTPLVPKGQESRVRRVLSDAHQQQREWYKRTGFFPILHVIAIREEALKARPSFGEEICAAYDAAKQYAYNVLQDDRMTGLPLMRGYLDEAMALGGDDPWPYGLKRNRAEIDRFLDLALDHGLTSRRIAIEEMFDERAAGFAFTARMTPGCITGTMDRGWAPDTIWPA